MTKLCVTDARTSEENWRERESRGAKKKKKKKKTKEEKRRKRREEKRRRGSGGEERERERERERRRKGHVASAARSCCDSGSREGDDRCFGVVVVVVVFARLSLVKGHEERQERPGSVSCLAWRRLASVQ